MSARCKSCGAPVLWARLSVSSRMIPLDASPLPYANGNIVIDESDVPVARVVSVGKGTHVSHFATCPDAKRHRRERTD